MPVAEFGGVGAAVLFSVCCRRHLFCLASVLFVERNTFGTTHFQHVWNKACDGGEVLKQHAG